MDNQLQTTVKIANQQGISALHSFVERYKEACQVELDAFIQAILKQQPFVPSGVDGLKTQILADATIESWQSGKTIFI